MKYILILIALLSTTIINAENPPTHYFANNMMFGNDCFAADITISESVDKGDSFIMLKFPNSFEVWYYIILGVKIEDRGTWYHVKQYACKDYTFACDQYDKVPQVNYYIRVYAENGETIYELVSLDGKVLKKINLLTKSAISLFINVDELP